MDGSPLSPEPRRFYSVSSGAARRDATSAGAGRRGRDDAAPVDLSPIYLETPTNAEKGTPLVALATRPADVSSARNPSRPPRYTRVNPTSSQLALLSVCHRPTRLRSSGISFFFLIYRLCVYLGYLLLRQRVFFTTFWKIAPDVITLEVPFDYF